jgi:hypothetical protein
MICDQCGVKVTTRQARRQRFGHMTLPVSVAHPLGEAGERLSTLPVLPAAFWQAPAGSRLAERYDELARAVTSGLTEPPAPGRTGVPDGTAQRAEQRLAGELAKLFELLLSVATLVHEWDLAEAQTLAHGLALTRRDDGG